VAQRLPSYPRDQIVSGDLGHSAARTNRRAADVRDNRHIGQRQQGVIGGQRFGRGHVQRCATELAFNQRFVQRILIDHAPPCSVDQQCSWLQQRQRIAVDQVTRLRVERGVQRDKVRLPQQIVECGALRPMCSGFLVCQMAAVSENMHIECRSALRYRAPDASKADDPQGRSAQICAQQPHRMPRLPTPALDVLHCFDNSARACQQQRHRDIRRCLSQDTRCVSNGNPSRVRGSHIDVIDPDRHLADDLEVTPGSVQQRPVHTVGDHAEQPINAAHTLSYRFVGGRQLVLPQVNLADLTDAVERFVKDAAGDKNFWLHDVSSLMQIPKTSTVPRGLQGLPRTDYNGQPMNTHSPPRTWVAALLLIAVLVGWRIVAIQHTYMRDDEEIAFRTTQYDLGYTLWYQAQQDIQAPLWFAVFWAWQQVAGSSEFAARILSILLMMLTLALVYQIARRWFGSARFRLLAILILGINSYFFIYTLEIRPYPLVMLTSALSMLGFERWLSKGTPRAAAAYGLTLALALYVHYFLAFLVAAQLLYLIFFARLTRTRVVQFAGAAALGFALWLPWLPNFFSQLAVLRRLAEEADAVYGLGIGTTSTAEPTDLTTISRLVQIATNGLPVLYAAVLLLGLADWARLKRMYTLAALWALGVPAIALVLNLVMAVYAQRYVSYLSIGLALACAAALAALRPRWLRWSALTAFVGLNLWAIGGQLPVRIPFRDLFTTMSIDAQAGDVVYFTRAGEIDNLVLWQVRNYLSPDFEVILDHDLTRAEAERRVWFVTGDWFNDEVRADFGRLEQTHPVQTVLGQCDRAWCYLAQLMEAPPDAEPTQFGGVLPFRGADIDSVTAEAIQVRLWWQTDERIPLDYSIGLHLRDSAGNLVAQSDGAIQHYGVETVQTSQMQPGHIYIDHRMLALPPDLPNGSYQLVLVVYQSWDNARLMLPDGSDALLLIELNLPSALEKP
jgi:hypothetical protein